MAAEWLQNGFWATKKDGAKKTPPETKRSEKTLGIYKRNKTPNMPTSEEL